MKIKEGFIKKNIGGVEVVVAVGEASVGFNSMITINSTGAFLWSLLENDISVEELTAAMLEKYDVDEVKAKQDVEAFVAKAKNAGIIE